MAASKAKTFTDFAAEVQSTLKDYNINHLRAEFNTAKKAARSAKRWAKAIEDSDIFPNIEYTSSTAIDPRDVHKPYYGMIRPIDDPIWATILPPSDWGCQCGWKTTDKPVTKAPATIIPPEPGLDNNPGKDGALISPTHPHIVAGKKQAEAILKQNIVEMYGIDEKDIVEFYHDKKTNGCYFAVEKLSGSEKVANRRIAKVYANKGAVVELYSAENLDSKINGVWNEFKSQSIVRESTIDKMLYDKNEQFVKRILKGDITIELPKDFDKNELVKGLKNRASRTINGTITNIENVHFIVDNKYIGSSTIGELAKGIVPIK